jgi:hypothetical protein
MCSIRGLAPNKHWQQTVTHRMPRHLEQRAAAELRRYASVNGT